MNPLLSLLRSLKPNIGTRTPGRSPSRRKSRGTQSRPASCRLYVEALEDRTVPATISVANASLNEIGDVSAFIAAGSGGLSSPKDLTLGPDGNLYVANGDSSILRYNASTGSLIGTFVAAGSGGLNNPYGLTFGPDGSLYVSSRGTDNAIRCYNGTTGAFIDAFVPTGADGLSQPAGITFGADGNLYVVSNGTSSVLRFEGPLGSSPGSPLPASGQTGATFVAIGSGGLAAPADLIFGPDGNLYVSSQSTDSAVLKFDGNAGSFISTDVTPGEGGLVTPRGLAFDQDNRLYVADIGSNAIHRYDSNGQYVDDPVVSSATSQRSPVGMIFDAQGDLLVSSRDTNAIGRYDRGVTVTLSAASATPVSVAYATADGTATAGTDYTAQSGTVTFAPGQTSRLVLLATHYDGATDGNETLSVQLSNPSGATIDTGTATVTMIEPVHTSFSGTVFNDTNGNGVQDTGESGLAGWTVWLDPDRDGIFNNNEPSAITDANGHYLLDTTANAPGTGPSSLFYLAFGLQNGDGGRWVPTTPVFAPNDPTSTPNAVANFGVKFQPYGSVGPEGSETAVNVTTTENVSTQTNGYSQPSNAMSADANDDYVLAWQYPQGSGTAISARVYNADGTPRTGELAVGTGVTGTGTPSVAMGGNGQFVVAWQSNSSTISMAIYQLNGTLISKSNTISSNWLQGAAADALGNFAVLYGGNAAKSIVQPPTVQRYKSTGAANGSAITVASPSLVNYQSAIGMDGNGNFTVSWNDVFVSRGHGTSTSTVYFQRYTSAGKASGSPVIVVQSSTHLLGLDSLAMNSSGQFVVTWSDSTANQTYAQVYTAAGSPSGSAVNVTAVTASSPSIVTTAIDAAGNVTFAWTGDTSSIGNSTYLYSAGDVFFRKLTAVGQLTPVSIANTTTPGSQAVAGIAATGKGTFVLAWVGNGAGDSNGIFLQRFAGGPQIGSITESASTVTGGSALTLSASNFTDPNAGATITQVAFYATDSTGNQYLLGYGTNSNGVCTSTFAVNLAPGTYTLFAEATDSDGVLGGDSTLLNLTVQ
jgi:sugar lactone lactonase YvrE